MQASCRTTAVAAALVSLLLAGPAMAQDAHGKRPAIAPEKVEVRPKGSKEGSTDETAQSGAKGPVATPDETVHDFGAVWADKPLKHTFKIKNTGDELLKIVSVKPGCGCTKAGPHPNQLAPGEEGDFSFQLNSAKLHGKFTKPITVTTNQRGKSSLRLTLTGQLKHFVEVQPRVVQFGKVDEDTVATKKVTVINNTDKPMALTVDPASKSGTFTAQVAEVTPGKEFQVSVTAQPPYQQKMNRYNLKLKTSLEEQDSVEVVCMANYPPRLEVTPDSISLRKVSTESKRKLRFDVNGDKPVSLVSAESLDGKMTVEYRAIEEGRKYDLTVNVPADYEPPATGTAIVLKTDDEKVKELRVPVRALPTPSQRNRTRVRPSETLSGKPAPLREFKTIDGKEMQIGGHSDHVKVVAFYASWCGFCKRALPWIQEYYDESKSQDVDVVLINVDDRGNGKRARTEEQTLDHYRTMKLSIPMHMDSDKSITPAYKVSSYPTLFVLDKEGKVEDVIFGAKPDLKAMLDKDVTKLLAGKSLLSDDGKKAGGSDAAAMRAKPASAKRLEVAPNNKSDGAKERTEKKSDDK